MSNSNYWANLAVNKSRVKEYADGEVRIVYLNNETEFQIELFNPNHFTIGVTLAFDEKDESSNMLVIKPGERVWLDRYLHTPKKFKFSTYTVDNTEEVKDAISENGKLTIRFYKEYEVKTDTYARKWICQQNWRGDNNPNHVYYLSEPISTLTSATTSFNDSITTNYCCSNLDASNTINLSASTINYCDNIETGRIEEGTTSDQMFKNINKSFEDYPFKTERFKLLPTSQKPITSSDLTKKYCFNCGKKIKEKFKFCPFCGTEQE